jgi:outer membrane protein OmpA-like peptidoglycan-associated protein/ribosomal protein L18
MALTPKAHKLLKNLGLIAVLALIGAGIKFGAERGYLGQTMASLVPNRIAAEALTDSGTTRRVRPQVAQLPLPSSVPAALSTPRIPGEIWAWNGNAALIGALGGAVPMKGSIAERRGVNVSLRRQDDVAKMQQDLLKYATDLEAGRAAQSDGVAFVTIMGDGAGAFLAGINPQLEKIGPEYVANVVGIIGYSHGEDKLMGPQIWRDNPQSMRGALISGYVPDGDWNIAMRYSQANDLRNNPDMTTYDPDAVNWVNAKDFLDAPAKYIAGYCEERPVVREGKRTGERKRVCVDGTVTWTPGDVNVARQKGGLVNIASTRQWTLQMPTTVIMIRKVAVENTQAVAEMLAATWEAADQINAYPSALTAAMKASAALYAENDYKYWEKYFKGVVEKDVQGLMVELGGSRVANLADNIDAFGLETGLRNGSFAATYITFGDIVVQQYPNLYPSYPPLESVVYLGAVNAARAMTPTVTASAEQVTYSGAAQMTNVFARGSYTITFRTGSAEFTPQSIRVLNELYNHLVIARGSYVQINGHTDNVGSDATNEALSQLRANAVQEWLEQKSPSDFPPGRLRALGMGSRAPRADNNTSEGRALNRRVEIVIGEGK